MWAMKYGIHEHPEWYPGLSASSTSVDFQASMHASGHGHGTCPEPCAPSESCHTAVEGDDCYGHVLWAITTGIDQYPQWYPGLSQSSTFLDFQNSMHLTGHGFGTCPAPCEPAASGSTTAAATSMTTTQTVQPSTTLNVQEAACHTAVMGEECYGHVQWAMGHGIVHYAQWYPGLTKASSFEDFQASLHANGHGQCMQPCSALSAPSVTSSTTTASPDACHTAVETDECYGHVLWAMGTGIHNFPSWYAGLSPQSSFVEFQASMHMTGHGFGTCPQPCLGLDGRKLADAKTPRGRTAPSPGAVAEVTISVPVTTTWNASTLEGDAHLMATMRAVGQTLLGLDDSERKLVKVALSTVAPKAAGAAIFTFVASVPAERASGLRVKTAEDVAQSFRAQELVHEIVPASGETMKSFLLLSDAPHLVVAIIVTTLPAPAPQPHPDASAESSTLKLVMPTVSSTTMSTTTAQVSSTPKALMPTAQPSIPTLRGTTTAQAKSSMQSRPREVEASGATGHSSIVFTIFALVCTISS